MEKERKSKLMRSYIYEDEEIDDEEDEKSKEDSKEELDIRVSVDDSFTDPLINNIVNKQLNTSNKSNRSSKPKFTGDHIEEKQLLYDMGFKSNLINTIYNNMHPIDLQEALDYLNKNDQGRFTHSYIENDRFVCAICSQGRHAHENTALFVDNLNNNRNNGATPAANTNNNNIININVASNQNNNNITNRNNINNNTTTARISNRYSKYENSYLNSLNKNNYGNLKECGICGEKIDYTDSYKVKISCGHTFCVDCWENYLQEKIKNLNVAKISCMQQV